MQEEFLFILNTFISTTIFIELMSNQNFEDFVLINLSWPPCDLKDTKNIDDKYICPKCKCLMVSVHQADDCGCRYCLDCLDQM